MNKNLLGGVFLLAGIALVPTQAGATPILLQRCNADSLDPTQAAARIEWARKCGLIKNVGSPTFSFDTGVPASNGGTLVDYLETDPDRNPLGEGSFSGTTYMFEVNSTYTNTLYMSGGISQTTDVLGYKKWERAAARKRLRPLYPTFGTTADITEATNVQLWPGANPDDCSLYKAGAGGVSTVSTTYYVNGYCEASCYTPEQEILFENGYVSILDALNKRQDGVVTLSADSTLDNLKLQKSRTYSYTVETRETKHNIYVLSTQSGGQLRVTDEHPVINGEGRIVQAKTLKVGQELMRADGTPDAIVSIQKSEHFGKVYNLSPDTENLVSNVLVAQGFLVGSSRYQNDDVSYINRIILNSQVPSGVIP